METPSLIRNAAPEAGVNLIHKFAGTRPPVEHATLDELNKVPPMKGWGSEGYNMLKLDPIGRVFDKLA